MGILDDILAGATPDQARAGGYGGPSILQSSDNWLSDLSSAASSIASGVGSYFQNQQAIKGAMKIATAQTGGRPALQYPGLGYSANQLTPYGAMQPSQGALPVQPLSQAGMISIGGPMGLVMGDQNPGAVFGGVTGGGSSTAPLGGMFRTNPNPSARAIRMITGVNPINGQVHVWWHVGSMQKIVREGLRSMGLIGGRRRARRRSRRRFC